MSNYMGTIFRIGCIFIFLVSVWITIALVISLLITFLFSINLTLPILLCLIMGILIIRIFYPKNIFKN